MIEKVREYINGQIRGYTLENLKMIKRMAMEYYNFQMVGGTRGNG